MASDAIESVLKNIIDPHSGKNLLAAGAVKKTEIAGDLAKVVLELGYPAKTWIEELKSQVDRNLRGLSGVNGVEVSVTTRITSHSVQKNLKPMKSIKNIIAVASGKGGVGKSTVAVNLALALSAEGARVGVLDADIYGPSQPKMLGISDRPESRDGKSIEPLSNHQVQAMSIGFLVEEETPMIWRGPMVTQALDQLLNETNWDDLDYLVVDLPPGTGDIQLTLAQKVPVTGAIIVTTPQDIALLDARKAVKMFEKVDIRVLGVVENMSTHVCSQCGHEEAIFGAGGGERMASGYGIKYLGALPLDIRIREDADGGRPTVVAEPEGDLAGRYRSIARKTAASVAAIKKDFSSIIPTIKVN